MFALSVAAAGIPTEAIPTKSDENKFAVAQLQKVEGGEFFRPGQQMSVFVNSAVTDPGMDHKRVVPVVVCKETAMRTRTSWLSEHSAAFFIRMRSDAATSL